MLLMTRPEKAEEMSRLVYALRDTAAGPARDGDLNLAEVINAMGQALASVLVGAYEAKSREVVLSFLPDLVRGYFPQWEKIYAEHERADADKARDT